jgi:hypothetical protein
MKTRDWMIATALALCAVVLVACGGGGASGSAGGGGGGAGGAGAGGGASSEEAALAFAECLRAHGVEVEDPQPGKGLAVEAGGDPTTKQALAACHGKLGDAGQELGAEEGEEFKEGWLAFAKCVRGQGIDMGDPTFLGPGKVHLDIEGIDTESPAFEAAAEACQGLTPETEGVNIGG